MLGWVGCVGEGRQAGEREEGMTRAHKHAQATAPPAAAHSLKRRVRQGMMRARWAMMDMRCNEGWRLNRTMSPSVSGVGGCGG